MRYFNFTIKKKPENKNKKLNTKNIFVVPKHTNKQVNIECPPSQLATGKIIFIFRTKSSLF